MKSLSMIAAITKKSGIGKNGMIPWHYPNDLKHFRKTTLFSNIIMGRNTWESLPKKPLPNRRNIVITSHVPNSHNWNDTFFVNSPEKAITIAEESEYPQTWIIGGQRVYESFIHYPQLLTINITIIPDDIECDTFFPNIPYYFNVKQINQLDETLIQKLFVSQRFLPYDE